MPRMLSLLVVTAALVVAGTVPAAAGASDTRPFFLAFVIQEDDLLVLNGPPFEEGCVGEGFVTSDAHVVDTPSDRENLHVRYDDEVRAYDMAALGFANFDELIGAACAAVATGGDVPPALAVGEGSVRVGYHCELGPDGPTELGCFESIGSVFRLDVAIRGTVTDVDGNRWRATASFDTTITVTADGDIEDARPDRTRLQPLPN